MWRQGAVAMLVFAIAGCSEPTVGGPDDGVTPATLVTPTGPSGPQTLLVRIEDGGFAPSALEVAVGDSVRWVNYGPSRHTVSADDDPEFDSGEMGSGQSFPVTFQEPMRFSYHCRLHPSMTGTVLVA